MTQGSVRLSNLPEVFYQPQSQDCGSVLHSPPQFTKDSVYCATLMTHFMQKFFRVILTSCLKGTCLQDHLGDNKERNTMNLFPPMPFYLHKSRLSRHFHLHCGAGTEHQGPLRSLLQSVIALGELVCTDPLLV